MRVPLVGGHDDAEERARLAQACCDAASAAAPDAARAAPTSSCPPAAAGRAQRRARTCVSPRIRRSAPANSSGRADVRRQIRTGLMPRAPTAVETTGSPAAMKSNILMLVPEPENIGLTRDVGRPQVTRFVRFVDRPVTRTLRRRPASLSIASPTPPQMAKVTSGSAGASSCR